MSLKSLSDFGFLERGEGAAISNFVLVAIFQQLLAILPPVLIFLYNLYPFQ